MCFVVVVAFFPLVAHNLSHSLGSFIRARHTHSPSERTIEKKLVFSAHFIRPFASLLLQSFCSGFILFFIIIPMKCEKNRVSEMHEQWPHQWQLQQHQRQRPSRQAITKDRTSHQVRENTFTEIRIRPGVRSFTWFITWLPKMAKESKPLFSVLSKQCLMTRTHTGPKFRDDKMTKLSPKKFGNWLLYLKYWKIQTFFSLPLSLSLVKQLTVLRTLALAWTW